MIPIIAAGLIAYGLLRSSRANAAGAAGADSPNGSGGSPGAPGALDFVPGVNVGGPGGSGSPGGPRNEFAPPPPAYSAWNPFGIQGGTVGGSTGQAGGGAGWSDVDWPVLDLCGNAFIPERCFPTWGGGMNWFERYGKDDCGTCKAYGKRGRLIRRKG